VEILIDLDMKKMDLRDKVHMSTNTLARLSKNENVTTDILVRICTTLNCDLTDIMEILPD